MLHWLLVSLMLFTAPAVASDKTLLKAAKKGRIEEVNALLASGASADAADRKGYTALMAAAANGHGAIALALINAGATLDLKDRSRRSALDWAKRKEQAAIVELLQFYSARDAQQIDLLERFITEYPAGSYTSQAKESLHEAHFLHSIREATVESYRNFIEQFPHSGHVPTVREALRGAWWRKLTSTKHPSSAELSAFIGMFPQAGRIDNVQSYLARAREREARMTTEGEP